MYVFQIKTTLGKGAAWEHTKSSLVTIQARQPLQLLPWSNIWCDYQNLLPMSHGH